MTRLALGERQRKAAGIERRIELRRQAEWRFVERS
jgi:hypothetical protein